MFIILSRENIIYTSVCLIELQKAIVSTSPVAVYTSHYVETLQGHKQILQ